MPKVSIIIPVYNVEKYLRQALDSVINQTLSDIEIICIDDCSTDNSLSILHEYANKDSRFKIFHLNENRGQGYARNFGLEKASGEYIGFVDSDDWIEPNMYEVLYSYAQQYQSDLVDAYYILHKEYPQKTEIIYHNGDLKHPQNTTFNKEWNPKYIFSAPIGPCCKLFKTKLILHNNITFDNGTFAEDQIFVIKCRFFATKIYFCQEHLYHYRIRRNSSCDIGFGKNAVKRIEQLKKIKEFFVIQDYFEKVKKSYWKFALNRIVSTYQRCPILYRRRFHKEIKRFLPRKYYHQYKERRKYYTNISEILYSIKNMQLPSGKYQILTILGIKIPLRKYVR